MRLLSTFFCAAFLWAGCGTLLHSNPQTVSITSDPPGAAVAIDGEARGVTPLEVALDTTREYDVTVTAQGYTAETRRLERSVVVSYIIGNIFLLVFPIAIDYYTDSMHDLDTEEMHFQFAAPAPISSPPDDAGDDEPLFTTKTTMEVNGEPVGGAGQDSSEQYCCVNGAYYDCPDLSAVKQCAPPELGSCMMSCDMSDFGCPDACLEQYPPDPSRCERQPNRDAECR